MFIHKTIALAVASAAAILSGAACAGSASTTDCVLNWAERTYPGAFSPAGAVTQSANGYSYRYYSGSNAHLGVQNSENYLYYVGPLTNNSLTKIDPPFHYLSASKCPAEAAGNVIEFAGISYPASDSEKRGVMAASQAYVNGNAHAIAFNTILRSGQTAGGGVFGQVYDSTGNVIRATDGSARISDDNDHSTLIDLFGKVFMVSQFESRPAAFYITELSQAANTGKLTALSTKPIDFSSLGGGWVHCAGMRTPWKSHLGSEEYEPDARMIDAATGIKGNACEVNATDCVSGYKGSDTYYGAMGDYFGGDMKKVNPYRYGYIVEAKITGSNMGSGTFASNVAVTRHYAMGRTANEMAYVMPDGKTAYITDDGNMVGLYMYKADNAEDLSAGTLYAAKLTQTSADNGGAFTLSWISLGSANNAEIKALVDGGIIFSDLFDAAVPSKDSSGNYSCASGYAGVSHGHATQAGGTYNECLKLKTGNAKSMSAAAIEKAASRLETRRYAALKGATTELNKEEGITFNPEGRKLYIAMSDVTGGMKANSSGAKSTTEAFTSDDIRLVENRCGVVYELEVDASYQATSMRGLVTGKAAVTGDKANTCDLAGIANPDNLTYLPGYNTLLIGEDTGTGHQNDLIWAYNLTSKSLTRIFSTPYGAETTSPYFYPNINGWGYVMGVVQHPYGESDTDKAESGSAERRAYTGYIGPFPRMD